MGAGMGAPAGAHGGAGGAAGGGGGGGGSRWWIRKFDATLMMIKAGLPYKTRGFYLSVVMDHRKVPTLISELTSSASCAWPVEIVRVQVTRIFDDDVEGSAGGTMGGGFAGNPFGQAGSKKPIPKGPMGIDGPILGGAGAGAPVNNPQADAAQAALDNALQDPFMARVALCGIITLYTEVKPDPSLLPPAAPSGPAATTSGPTADVAVPAPNEATPAAGATTEQSAEAPATGTTAAAPADKSDADAGKPASSAGATDAPATESKPAEPKPAEPSPEPKGATNPNVPPPGNNK